MGAAHRSFPNMHGRRQHLIRIQPIHQPADRCYIRKRISRPQLVKMDLLRRHIVHPALCLRHQTVNGQNILFHFIAHRKMIPDDMLDPMQAMVRMIVSVAIMRMGMHLLGFFLSIHKHADMRSVYSAFHRGFLFKTHVGHMEPVQFLQGLFRIRCQFEECSCQHISGCTHSAIDIQ